MLILIGIIGQLALLFLAYQCGYSNGAKDNKGSYQAGYWKGIEDGNRKKAANRYKKIKFK